MIIIDTNVISYFFFEGQYTEQAEFLFEQDPVWAAPLLWRSEFRNVIALYLRKKIITYKDALEIAKEAETLMQDNEYSVESHSILELVKNSSCSAYDCEFIWLAKELDIPLITEDKKILKEFPKYTTSLRSYLRSN